MPSFIDRVVLHVAGGDGGNGCTSVHREKFKPLAGPDGGDGGHGGDVVLTVDPRVTTLLSYHRSPHQRAGNGTPGMGDWRRGTDGKNLVLPVPEGTVVKDSRGQVIADLVGEGTSVVVAQGGTGGRGNFSLASSKRRAPGFHLLGEPGQGLDEAVAPRVRLPDADADGGLGQGAQIRQVTALHGAPLLDDRHVRAQVLHLRQDVAGQQDGGAPVRGLADHVREDPLHEGVQARGRLVEDEQVHGRGQGGHERHLLRVALGVGPHFLGEVQVEALGELLLAGAVARAAQARQGVEHLPAREVGPQAHRAGHVGEAAVDGGGFAGGVHPQDAGAAAVGVVHAQQDADRRGLPRAVGAQEAVDLAFPNTKVEAVQGLDLPETLDEALGLDEIRQCSIPFLFSLRARARTPGPPASGGPGRR